jgi:Holliday junction resolvasome RuvABC endonuclease subunit
MTRVLALDQATRSGWTFGGTKLDLRQWKSGHFSAPRRDEEGERLNLIYDNCLCLIDEHQPDLVAYEEPFDPTWDALEALKKGKQPRSNFNRTTLTFLERVKGAVMMAASRRSVPTEGYSPRQWQATLQLPKTPAADPRWDESTQVKLRQKWRKQAIFKRVLALGGRITTEDEADSWGICLHACHGKVANARAQTDLFEKVVL